MDYNVIKNFIDKNPPENISIDVDISQKEKKFIEKYISNIVFNINFEG